MSQFIERLQQLNHTTPQPMGFHRGAPTPDKPRMLLIADFEGNEDNTGLIDAAGNADAVILTSGESAVSLPKNALWGVRLAETGEAKINQSVKSDADFIIFPADGMVMGIPNLADTGKVMQISASLDEGLVKTINRLPVDAVLITADKNDVFYTWHQLMQWQRITALLHKPIMLILPRSIGKEELQTLWEIGIDGVVLGVNLIKQNGINKLHKIISDLPPRSALKNRKDALLPAPQEKSETTAEIDEEEEEE